MKVMQRLLRRFRPHQQYDRRRGATLASAAQQAALLHQLCSQCGIRSAVTIGRSSWGGSGLFRQGSCGGGQQHLLASVPLRLVLSNDIPGCSPQPAELEQQQKLRPLLHDSCCAATWELQVAVLLLWALRQPPDSSVGGFWRRYARAFIPPLAQQASLLLWSQHELDELQDPGLAATAAAWQQQVRDAHAAVAPCFSTSSMDEWLWAVSAVESRAFAVSASSLADASVQRAGGSRECVGLVPLLDLANHTCRSQCHHSVDVATSSFDLFDSSTSSDSSDSSTAGEVLISYGDKHNSALMEQYGFSVPGNPFDRLAFPQDVQQQRMSHDAVKRAGTALKQRLAAGHAPPHLAAVETGGVAAAAVRVDAAVASVIAAAGWRNLAQGREVSAASTAACASALLRWVQQQQQQAACGTSVQHDVSLLAAAATAGGSSDRLRAAVSYRLERKQLVDTAGLLVATLAA